ncbi:SDR family NAD(P)-dependent oxidoreductase [Gordonia sp. CPCC 206044]|uniref:SDR family NAD(P)-dependent oxidoreductase n=1 Tax=Gordonia sp. CPCC 206044 TaxID=3140793 RepID=UPI003AF38067
MSVTGEVALVTGATSGIGRATALQLAWRGAHVLISGRDADRGAAVVTEVRNGGGTADFLAADLADPDSCRALAQNAIATAGQVDILVNNAAIAPMGPTPTIAEADLDACYAVNVKAPFFLVAALAPAMAERGHGTIVNVSTMVASFGTVGSGVYGSSKAALELLTKSWAAEFGPRGVRVNAVAPGPTMTDGTAEVLGEAGLTRLAKGSPARRFAAADEIADVVCYLAGTGAGFVHGAVVPVDGGRSAV